MSNTFKKRSGTTDKGKDYEHSTSAYLPLKLLGVQRVDQFEIASNDARYGDFDDIVLKIKNKDKSEDVLALQLKHGESAKLITKNALSGDSGDFSLRKYFKGFQEKKFSNDNNLKLCLYTNRKLNDPQQENNLDFGQFKVKFSMIEDPEFGFINTSQNQKCFKFEMDAETCNDTISAQDVAEWKDFFGKFYLFANQCSLEKMDELIEQWFKNLFHCHPNCCNEYVNCIKQWSRRDGIKEILDDTTIRAKISEILLSPHVAKIDSKEDITKSDIFHKIFSRFDVSIMGSDSKLKDIFGAWLHQLKDVEKTNQVGRKFGLLSEKTLNCAEMAEDELVKILWHIGQMPLPIKLSKDNQELVYRAIQLCLEGKINRKFLLIGDELVETEPDWKVFKDLSNLYEHSDIYQRILQICCFRFQHRGTLLLKDIDEIEQIENVITGCEISKMLDSPLNIGENLETLPDIYIEQSLSKIVIDIKYLHTTNNIAIINCNGNLSQLEKILGKNLQSVEDYLNHDSHKFQYMRNVDNFKFKHVYVSENACTEEDFSMICKKASHKICNLFQITESGNLEFLQSNQNLSELRGFQTQCESWTGPETFMKKQLNIICAEAGFGKTVLMKYLNNNYLSDVWVVKFNCRDHQRLFSEEYSNVDDALRYILDYQSNVHKYNKTELAMRKFCFVNKKLVFLFDGLDELPNNCLEHALNIFIELHEKGFFQWITSRVFLKNIIEEQLNVFAHTLKEFDEEQQLKYMEKYFKYRNNGKEIQQHKLKEIQGNVINTLTLSQGQSVLGVPLQISILAEFLFEDPEKYSDLLKHPINLTDIFRYSIEEKFNFAYKNKGTFEPNNFAQTVKNNCRKFCISQYEIIALKLSLPEDVFKALDVSCEDDFLEDIKKNGDVFGIITSVNDERASFLHNVYCEYFVSLWLSKNYKRHEKFKLEDFIFEDAFRNVRLFFDLILAEDHPAHIAVLCRNLQALEKCSRKRFIEKDKGGRSPLHLACSWGHRHPMLIRPPKQEEIYVANDAEAKLVIADHADFAKIVELLTFSHKSDVFERDDLYRFNCFEYADYSQSLLPLDTILKESNYNLDNLKKVYDIYSLLYYCVRFDYKNLFCLLQDIPYFETMSDKSNLMHLAARYGRTELLEKILSNSEYQNNVNKNLFLKLTAILLQGVNIEISSFLIPPLHLALLGGHVMTAKTLLSNTADARFVDKGGRGVFHYVNNLHDRKIFELLVEHGADVHQKDKTGANALFKAVSSKNLELINFLLDKKIEIVEDVFGRSVLDRAVSIKDQDILDLLVEKSKFQVNMRDLKTKAFICAVSNDDVAFADYFLNRDIDANMSEKETLITALHLASFNGNEILVRKLLQKRVSVDARDIKGDSAMFYASFKGHLNIVRMLTRYCDINALNHNGQSALHNACYYGHYDIVDFLINNNAVVDIKSEKYLYTPLFEVVSNDRQNSEEAIIKIAQRLLKAGANINDVFENKNNILMQLISPDISMNIVKFLFESGININHSGENGFTPLHFAVFHKKSDLVQFLVSKGANVMALDDCGRFPLHCLTGSVETKDEIVEYKHFIFKNIFNRKIQNAVVDIAKCLLKHTTDVNVKDQKGLSSLHIAVINNNIDVVRLLIDAGSDINSTDDNICTPLHYAVLFKHFELITQLVAKGASINSQDYLGVTVLHLALCKPNLLPNGITILVPIEIADIDTCTKIVTYLLKNGADVKICTNSGFTALDDAKLLRLPELLINMLSGSK